MIYVIIGVSQAGETKKWPYNDGLIIKSLHGHEQHDHLQYSILA